MSDVSSASSPPSAKTALVGDIDMASIMRDYELLMKRLACTEEYVPTPTPASMQREADDNNNNNNNNTNSTSNSSSYGEQYMAIQSMQNKTNPATTITSSSSSSSSLHYAQVPPPPPSAQADGMSSLLEALHLAEKRAAMAREDCDIIRLEGEAQLADVRVELQRTTNKLHAIMSERGLEEVYTVLEEDCQRQAKELAAARLTISQLEERASVAEARLSCRDVDRASATSTTSGNAESSYMNGTFSKHGQAYSHSSFGDSEANTPLVHRQAYDSPIGKGYTPSIGGKSEFLGDDPSSNLNITTGSTCTLGGAFNAAVQAKKEIKRLTIRIIRYAKEIETLQAENEQLHAQQRTHTISLRQSKDAARRVFLSNQANTRTQSNYEAEVTSHAATKRELLLVKSELTTQHQDSTEARHAIDMLQSQLLTSQNEVDHYKALVKEEHMLNRFVRKHVRAESLLGEKNGARVAAARKGDTAKSTGIGARASAGAGVNTSFRQTLREVNNKQQQQQNVTKSQSLRDALALDERAVNVVINDLRAACVFRAPDVLPYLKLLVERLGEERTIWKRLVHG